MRLLHNTGLMGLAFYAVFWLDQSGWWVLGALLVASSGFQPHKWRSIITGIKPKDDDIQPDPTIMDIT